MSCMHECFLLSLSAQVQRPSLCFSPLPSPLKAEMRCLSLSATLCPDEVSHRWVWQAGEHRQTRAALAISAHRLLEQVAGDWHQAWPRQVSWSSLEESGQ